MQQRYRLHLLGVLKVYKFQISTRVYLSQIRCLDPPFPPSPQSLTESCCDCSPSLIWFFYSVNYFFCHNLDMNKKNRKRKTQLGKLLFLLSRQHWHKIKHIYCCCSLFNKFAKQYNVFVCNKVAFFIVLIFWCWLIAFSNSKVFCYTQQCNTEETCSTE